MPKQRTKTKRQTLKTKYAVDKKVRRCAGGPMPARLAEPAPAPSHDGAVPAAHGLRCRPQGLWRMETATEPLLSPERWPALVARR